MANIKAYNGDEPYIFISYSHKDAEVESILREIDLNGYRFWYDEGIISGRAWAAEISNRLKKCCQFVVFISENSVKSENVKDEVHLAVKHNLDIQVIYIDDVVLDGELELHLDRKQAIHKNKYSTTIAFYNKLILGLSKAAVSKSGTAVDLAANEFKNQYTIINYNLTDTRDVATHIALKKNLNILTIAKHFKFKKSVYGSEIMNSAINEISVLKELQTKNSPFTPKAFDFFEDEENIFIAEEYIEGKNLEQVIAELDRSDPEQLQDKCVDICIKVCNILRYLHNLKSPIVHRDIKPKNLLLTEDNNVYLIDFDICLRYKEVKPFGFPSLGTKGYASPEQYSSDTVPDNRSDIYSLGILLKHLLSGKAPIEFSYDPRNVPLRYYSKKFSPMLEKIIQKMTMDKADERYSSVEEVLNELQNYNRIKGMRKLVLLMESNSRVKKYRKNEEKKKEEIRSHIPQGLPAQAAVPVPPPMNLAQGAPSSTQVPPTSRPKFTPNYATPVINGRPVVPATPQTAHMPRPVKVGADTPAFSDETTVLG